MLSFGSRSENRIETNRGPSRRRKVTYVDQAACLLLYCPVKKAAVNAITRSLAQELGARKIRVNSINPGMVETEGVHATGLAESDFRKQVEAQTPLGRIGQPQDIAPAAVYLASDDSSWITGESFTSPAACASSCSSCRGQR